MNSWLAIYFGIFTTPELKLHITCLPYILLNYYLNKLKRSFSNHQNNHKPETFKITLGNIFSGMAKNIRTNDKCSSYENSTKKKKKLETILRSKVT